MGEGQPKGHRFQPDQTTAEKKEKKRSDRVRSSPISLTLLRSVRTIDKETGAEAGRAGLSRGWKVSPSWHRRPQTDSTKPSVDHRGRARTRQLIGEGEQPPIRGSSASSASSARSARSASSASSDHQSGVLATVPITCSYVQCACRCSLLLMISATRGVPGLGAATSRLGVNHTGYRDE